MKKSIWGFFGFGLIFALLVIGSAGTAKAGLNVNINFGPPQIVEAAPPEVVMMPQSGVYFVPGVSFDVFFYNGYWWSPRGNGWYRARQYNGPWGVVRRNYVPAPLFRVPKDYRNVYQKERHINYGQWKKQDRNNNGNNGDHGRGH